MESPWLHRSSVDSANYGTSGGSRQSMNGSGSSQHHHSSNGQLSNAVSPNQQLYQQQQSRSSLGNFIERSTSAPPLSHQHCQNSMDVNKLNGDLVMGSSLLDCVTNKYNDMSLTTSATSLESGSGFGTDALLGSHSAAQLSSEADTVRISNSSGGDSSPFFTPRSVSGYSRSIKHDSDAFVNVSSKATNVRSVSASGGDEGMYGDFLGYNESVGLVRSQSAAPNVRPPPGLPSHSDDLKRMSSGGSSSRAVKPAAKTLMDLIQEDIPPEQTEIEINGSRRSLYELSSPVVGRRTSPRSSPLQGKYSQQSSGSKPFTAKYQDAYIDQGIQRESSQQYHHQQQQQSLSYDGNGLISTQHIPVNFSQQHRNNSPPIQQQQQQNMRTQDMGVQQQQQQQIFYQQQGIGQGMQNAQITTQQPGIPQNLQAQVLPNGQTVYVRVPSPPLQQQQFNGGNAGDGYTMQYQQQQPVPQQAVIHQAIAGAPRGNDQQYVSVVPLQGCGQQVTYWQPSSQQQPHRQGGMIAQQQQHNSNRHTMEQHQHYGGRSRGDSNRGGRGRRGGPSGRGRGNDFKQHHNHHSDRDNNNHHSQQQHGNNNHQHHNSTNHHSNNSNSNAAPQSSPLLEEFRTNKSRDWEVNRIQGHVVEFCQDQNGSRFIQQRLEMGNVAEQEIVMKEVLPMIRRLRNDVFGNYVVQKLLDFGTPNIRNQIRETLDGEMLQLSLQMYGCRVVQKALEAIDEKDLPKLLSEFHHNVLSCIHDQNGNHVIQKCIEVLNSRATKAARAGDTERAAYLTEQVGFVIDDVLVNTSTLSCHPYGCRVLQRILEHCGEPKKTTILDKIKECHKRLLDDQYGNYVIQHVLQYGREVDRDSILAIVVENGLLGLARQKFASNVVEKLLKYGNGNQRRGVVREMLKRSSDTSIHCQPGTELPSVALLMVRDAYANYVVQTTLDVVPESNEKQALLRELNSHSEELRNYTFAKHIVAKLAILNEEQQ